MKQITIIETRNGVLVVEGDGRGLGLSGVAQLSWSFNSLDAAIPEIRHILKSWRESTKVAKEKP